MVAAAALQTAGRLPALEEALLQTRPVQAAGHPTHLAVAGLPHKELDHHLQVDHRQAA